MLSVIRDNNGYVFSFEQNGKRLHFQEWEATDACVYYMPLSILVDNGCAIIDGDKCVLPFESLKYLDSDDLILLGLPPLYPYAIRLRGRGDFKSEEFYYSVEFLTSNPDGDVLSVKVYGTEVNISDGRKFTLSEEQFQFMKLIDAYNTRDNRCKTLENTLRAFADIKKASEVANVYLDSYLEGESVYVPSEIKIELSREGDSLSVLPSIDISGKNSFKQIFDKQRKILSAYPLLDENGNRTRVVLSENQKSSLQYLKKHNCRYSSNEEIQDIITHPTEYFDPDHFDLSVFYSDRVIELGFYKPKFYPFVSPYKSVWIAGATIENMSSGTTTIKIGTIEELCSLEDCIEIAVSENKTLCKFSDIEMDIEDAKFLVKMARKQLKNPNSPLKIEENENGKKVLIIEENAESTGYVIENKNLNVENQYVFYPNDNLRKEFNLKEHQTEGIAWFQYLLNNKASGCLMADDMGLGKTLQVLYFMDWHARLHPFHKPYLIVAPVSLIENWQNEYVRFFKKPMQISVLSTAQVPRKFDKTIIDMMQESDLIITNYETVRNCQLNFCAVDFDIIVLDEAQKVKSPGTLVTNAVKALKGSFKVAMTGTPVENSLLDLWCIMDFCVPGLLGNAKEFAKKYQVPLKDEDTDLIALGNDIHNQLGAYFMRRLKSDAAKDLPQKVVVKQQVNMPVSQERIYRQVSNSYNPNLKGSMLMAIMGIREVSEHPYLNYGGLSTHSCNELINDAARMIATIAFLDKIRYISEKAIIFAERKEIQKMLQRVVKEKYNYTPKIINGDVPTVSISGKESRQSAIDEFQSQSGFGVIIMSPIAAGMGLNVTAANHVIHYSRHWNPAKENQATDRAYRIGQEKDVYVYYPMAVSPDFKSFDITLDELLSRKTDLATSTIFPTARIEVKPEDFEQILRLEE